MSAKAQVVNKIKEWMDGGMSFEEAIEKALEIKAVQEIKTVKAKVWNPEGSYRCPICHAYGNLYALGKLNRNVLRLECKKHGTMYHTPSSQGWRSKETLDEDSQAII